MTNPDHIRIILETGYGDDWTRLYAWEGDTDLGPTLGLWQRIVRLLSEVQQPHDHGACTICEMQMRRIAELEQNHTSEGTVPCTCHAYPHNPNCGLDYRLVALRQRVTELEAREHAAVDETQTSDALDTIRTLCEERTQLQADLRTAAERYLDAMRDLGAAKARIEELEKIVGWDGDKILAVVQERNAAKARVAELERDKAA